ncbi:MAG: hypothetical protein CMJ18_22825 [Phycisphaeraceae bacterium]|nr:hypothetical protein [Phycisphaeraceae bacterium]
MSNQRGGWRECAQQMSSSDDLTDDELRAFIRMIMDEKKVTRRGLTAIEIVDRMRDASGGDR